MARRELFNYLGSYNKAYKNWQVDNAELDRFIATLADFLKETKQEDHEETIKSRFDRDVLVHFYKTSMDKDRVDLVVEEDGRTVAIFEFKRPRSKEMVTEVDVNRKSLHEAIWYFYNQEDLSVSRSIKTVVVTNTKKFFFFDPAAFWDADLRKTCEAYRSHERSYHTTEHLYAEIGEIIDKKGIAFDYAVFDLAAYRDKILSGTLVDADRTELANFYKALHSNFMLRKFRVNDSNELDRDFYKELMYIVGLEERLVENGRNRILVQSKTDGTIFDLIMRELDSSIQDKFEAALQLSIVWLNRVLFLKIFEGLLLSSNGGAKEYRFFDSLSIKDFCRLNRFFFQVLGRPIVKRHGEQPLIPYLNSALFEESEAEIRYKLTIDRLRSDVNLKLKSDSVLTKSMQTYPSEVPTLTYLLDFLGVHNFRSDVDTGDGKVKTINPSVLGLVFEKLNGYKDGSFYTPGVITEYMAKRTIDLAVLDKFSRHFELYDDKAFKDIKALRYHLHNTVQDMHIPENRDKYSAMVDELKICDPACGSGHFLVSALNYLIYLKDYLGLLTFDDYHEVSVEVWNDTLVVYDRGRQFEYRRDDKRSTAIQKKIFEAKAHLIKNCLFGVDINPNSVNICRLRLWIELLKNTYYVGDEEGNMQILPNIDINIAAGNSLLANCQFEVGKHPRVVDASGDSTKTVQMGVKMLARLKALKEAYKNERDKNKKDDIWRELRTLKMQSFNDDDEYGETLEWPLEFPETIDAEGRFMGFDIVIGNPPYIKERYHSEILRRVRSTPLGEQYHEGKMDYWYYFLHRAIDITNSSGVIAFITSSYWLKAKGAKKLRSRIRSELAFQHIVDLGNHKIFDDVAGYHMIAQYSKQKQDSFIYKELLTDCVDNIACDASSDNVAIKQMLNREVYTPTGEVSFYNVVNVDADCTLGQIADISQGEVEAPAVIDDKGVFVLSDSEVQALQLNDQERSLLVRYADGLELGRYTIKESTRWLIYSDRHAKNLIANDPQYARLKKHLDDMSVHITSDNKPYGLHRPRRKYYFETPKIIAPSMFKDCNFTIDYDHNYYVGMSYSCIVMKNSATKYLLEYILAVLNSTFARKWFYINGKRRGGGVDIGVKKLRTFPIVKCPMDKQRKIAGLVKRLVKMPVKDPKIDAEINDIIASIYSPKQ